MFVHKSLLSVRWGMNQKRQYGISNTITEVSARTLVIKDIGESAPRVVQGLWAACVQQRAWDVYIKGLFRKKHHMVVDTGKNRLPEEG